MAIAIQIAQIMFPLVAIISVGFIVGIKRPPDLHSINEVNLYIFIPALVFSALLKHDFELSSYMFLAAGAVILVFITAMLAVPIVKLLNESYLTIAPPLMFHNAGNIGLPLITLALGEQGLAAALILFLAGNVTHFGLGAYMLDRHAKWYRSMFSPPILAALLALAFQHLDLYIPDYIILPVDMLGSIAVPLLLFSLGVSLAKANLDHWKLGVIVGTLTPLLGVAIALLLTILLPLNEIQTASLLLFGALPPAVMNYLFAQRYSQEPNKVSAIVSIGNALAVITLPIALLFILSKYTLL
ncbi:MAG: AEC family transporter [Pseudomonadota bacterium]